MGKTIAFIDAGFLEAEGRKRLPDAPEGQMRSIDARGVIEWVRSEVKSRFPTDPEAFLRAYWYTAAFDPFDERFEPQRTFHGFLQSVPGIQLRLGRLVEREPNWHAAVKAALVNCGVELAEFEKHYEFRLSLTQKGVDSRIVLDIVRFAERRAYDRAILIAGDGDLAEAVQVAQDNGAKFVVAHPRNAGVAPDLRHLADEIIQFEKHELEKMFRTRTIRADEETVTLDAVAVD